MSRMNGKKTHTHTHAHRGGSIPQPFSNHKAHSIEHVEIDTKRRTKRTTGIGFSSHFISALPIAKLAFLWVSFILSPFLVAHRSIHDFVRACAPYLVVDSGTRSLSPVFGIPIDAGSFPEVDFSGAEITGPRRDGDGRSSAVPALVVLCIFRR